MARAGTYWGRCGEPGREESPAALLRPACSARASGRPSPAGPSQPFSRSASAGPARCRLPPRRPDLLSSERGRHLASPCGPQRSGVVVSPTFGPREIRVSSFLAALLGRALGRMLGVPGAVARGQSRSEPGGGDLPPLVILWATPRCPRLCSHGCCNLLRSFDIQELTHFKNG